MVSSYQEYLKSIGLGGIAVPPPQQVGSAFAFQNPAPATQQQYQRDVETRTQQRKEQGQIMAGRVAQFDPTYSAPQLAQSSSTSDIRKILEGYLKLTFPQMTEEKIAALDDNQIIALANLAAQQGFKPMAAPGQPQPAAPQAPAEVAQDPKQPEPKQEQPAEEEAVEIDLDAWRQAYPKETLETYLGEVNTEIATLEQTITSEDDPNYSLLQAAREDQEQLEALIWALYDQPPDGERKWYQKVLDYAGPVGDVLAPVLGAVFPIAGKFIEGYDKPRQVVGRRVGSMLLLAYANNPELFQNLFAGTGTGIVSNSILQNIVDSIGGAEEVNRLYQEGGLVGLWENGIAKVPELEGWGPWTSFAYHTGTDVASDPLTYIGAAAGATKGVPVIGKTLEALNTASNLPGDVVVGGVRKLGTEIGGLPGVRSLTRISEEGQEQIDRAILGDLMNAADQTAATTPIGTTPGGSTITRAPGGPIQEAFPSRHPDEPRITPGAGFVDDGTKPVLRPIATKADPLADLTGLDAPKPEIPGGSVAQQAARQLEQNAGALVPTAEKPLVTTATRWSELLKSGDKRVLDWMAAERRLSDRITMSSYLDNLRSGNLSLHQQFVRQRDEIFERAYTAAEQVNGTRYPNGKFYQKVTDRSLPLHEAVVGEAELAHQLGLPVQRPRMLNELPGLQKTQTKNAIQNAGPALIERLVYGTDKDVRAAERWLAAAAHRNLDWGADAGWLDEFLATTSQLRDRFRATLSKPSSGGVGITPLSTGRAAQGKELLTSYQSWIDAGKKEGFKVDPVQVARAPKSGGGQFADELFNTGLIDEKQWDWLAQPVDLQKAVGRKGISSEAKKLIQDILDENPNRKLQVPTNPSRGDVLEALRQIDAKDPERLAQEVMGLSAKPPTWFGHLGTATRQGFMYNLPRLVYNTTQDWTTDWFVRAVTDTPQDTARVLGKEVTKASLAKSVGKEVDQPVMQGIKEALDRFGVTLSQNVTGVHGPHFSNLDSALLEDGRSWWTKNLEALGSKVGGDTGGRIGKALGTAIAPDLAVRLRSGLDDVKRIALNYDYFMENVHIARDDFFDELRAVAPKMGLDPEEAVRLFDRFNGEFSPQDVYNVLGRFSGGQAEHLRRSWKSRLSQLQDAAEAFGNSQLFSYRQTNLDRALGKVWLFHYWNTRASVLHARLALEHPWLMAEYYRLWEGSRNLADKQEAFPAWARQFIALGSGPYGALMFVSPAAAFVGLGAVLDINGIDWDDPSVSDILTMLPLHPVFNAAASVYLNEQLPDILGQGPNRQFWKAAINVLTNELGIGDEGIAPDVIGEMTYKLQDLARQFLPGAEPLSAPSPSKRDTQTVMFYAAGILEERGELYDDQGGLTDHALQVFANIDAGLFSGDVEQEALDQFTIDQLTGQVIRAVMPVQGNTTEQAIDIRQDAREGRKEGKPQPDLSDEPPSDWRDIPFGEGRPTPEQKGADAVVDVIDAGSPQAATLQAELSQYNAIGTDEDRERWQNYNALIYGDAAKWKQEFGGGGIVIGGNKISWATWDAMGESARRAAMDAWVAEIGAKEAFDQFRAERKAYEESHPEIGAFKAWQDKISELGPQEALKQLEHSPSFMAWWQAQGPVPPADLRRVLMSPSAYLAAEGQQPQAWDSNAISQQPAADPSSMNVLLDFGGGGEGSTTYSPPWEQMSPDQMIQRLNEKLMEYQTKLNEFNSTIMGLTGGIAYENLAEISRMNVDVTLNRMGIRAPQPPEIVRVYFDWVKTQPQGADVSPAAWVNWFVDQREKMAA